MSKKLPPPPPAVETVETSERAWETAKVDMGVGPAVRIQRIAGDRGPLVPPVKPHVFERESLRELVWAVWPHDGGNPSPVLLTGPKGAGKTSLVEQVAARANVPLLRVNLTVGTAVSHLKGYRGVRDGSTVFYPGVVTRAMEMGAWLLLDEVSGATPNVALSLFPVLEPTGAVYLEDAEPARYVERHPDFRVFMTDNVIGHGQEESRFEYTGTNPDTNAALLDRVHSTIHLGYLGAEDEMAVVKANIPGVIPEFAELAVRTAALVRGSPNMPGFSTRMVIEWARRMSAGELDANGKPVLSEPGYLRAAEYAFLNRMSSRSDADTVREVILRLLQGKE